MDDAEKSRQDIQSVAKRKFIERIARALAVRDCAQADMALPEDDHDLWAAWNGGAEAVVDEMSKEFSALIEYENTINWMTTCTSCARVLESSYQETVRRELGELTLREISEWAHNTRHGQAAGEVLKILKNGEKRQDKTMKGENSEVVAGPQD